MISGYIMCTENVYFMSMTNKDHVHDVKNKKSHCTFTLCPCPSDCFLYLTNHMHRPKMINTNVYK